MLISAALSTVDPINDAPEPFNNIFFGGTEDRNPYSVLYSRPEDAENTINFINTNWQMVFDWNVSLVCKFTEDGVEYAVILPFYSQHEYFADCDNILQFTSDLVNYPESPVQNMVLHLRDILLESININRQIFRNTGRVDIVGFRISSLMPNRPEAREGEDMESDDYDSDSSEDSDESSSFFDSGSDSGPHRPDDDMKMDSDWSWPTDSDWSTDSGYGSLE